MEEKVKMEVIKNDSPSEPEVKPAKLNYEQLEGIAHQLSEQGEKLYKENMELRKALEQANLTNLFKRLDYLFRIVEQDNQYLTDEFKTKCGAEIEQMMTANPQEEESQE